MRSLLVAQVQRPGFVSVEAPLFVLFGAVFTVIGLGLLFTKIAQFREFLRVRSTPTSTLRAAAVGQIDVEGEGRAVDGAVRQPTGGECLCAVWEIGERSGDDDWKTTHTGMDGTRFVLRDGTGEILVENPERPFPHDSAGTERTPTVVESSASGAAVENRTEYRVRYTADDESGETHKAVLYIAEENVSKTTVSAGEEPPDGFRALCEREGIDPVVSHDRRFMELVLPVDETVYVHGQAVRVDDSHDRRHTDTNLLVRSNDARKRFLLADRDEGAFVDLLTWMWKTNAIAGALFFGLGLLAVLAGLGVV